MKLSQWVLDVVRVRLAVRGEDQGHTKDGRKGLGVHAACCERDFERLAEITASYMCGCIQTSYGRFG